VPVQRLIQAVQDASAIAFHEYFAIELEALKPLVDDGLIQITSDAVTVTPRGRLLVRRGAAHGSNPHHR
jgi:oxygen-independent coproporphyrinogen-3 oxidase